MTSLPLLYDSMMEFKNGMERLQRMAMLVISTLLPVSRCEGGGVQVGAETTSRAGTPSGVLRRPTSQSKANR